MLAFVIRMKDERKDSYYKNSTNLLNNYISGVNIEEARIFLDKESAEKKLAKLQKFLDTPFRDETIFSLIQNSNSKFNGFEIVDVEFDSIHYVIQLDMDHRNLYVRSTDYKYGDSPSCVTTCRDQALQFFSRRDAENEILKMKQAGFILSDKCNIEDVCANLREF